MDDLIVALRPVLIEVAGAGTTSLKPWTDLTVEMGIPRQAFQLRLRATVTGMGRRNNRETVGYSFTGSLLAPAGWVGFTGTATVDVATLAYFQIGVTFT